MTDKQMIFASLAWKKWFAYEWEKITRKLKESGADLNIPIISKST